MKNENPQISVILPVFNGEKYLEASLESVLGQDYGDFEFLICDDASLDASVKIIESRPDIRIRFFKNQVNQGLFTTLNLLIEKSRGKYIRLWSQDDVMKVDCLKEEMVFFHKHPEAGFCYCAYDVIDDSGKVTKYAPVDTTPEIIPPQTAAQIMFYYNSITGNIANVTIKKEVLDNLGLFRQDLVVSGDFEMWVRISKDYPIGFIRRSLVELRSHRKQLSRKRGMGLVFIREEKEIYRMLEQRLPLEIKDYAKRYKFGFDRVRNFHYLLCCFFTGEFLLSAKIYKELFGDCNIFSSGLLWLFSLNGRLLRKKPKFIN